MLNINKIASDINFKNLTKIDLSEILAIPYTTTINRLKNGNWTPDDVEKLADYFGRTIAYYFDREEKEQKPYKLPEDKLVVVEDKPTICAACAAKDKLIAMHEKHIELLEFNLGKYRKNGSE
jgi:hypothetical protein